MAAQAGLPGRTCAANNATSAVIDILIPPSIPMILFALVSVSIADLFIAGVLPGVLMAAGFILVCNLDRAPAGLRLRGAPHGAPSSSASWCAAARPS